MMENIVKIIEKHDGHSGGLISILQEIQGNYSYLPEEALRLVARETKFSLVDIYGVATFYKSFSLKPGGNILSPCVRERPVTCVERRASPRSLPTIWESNQERQPRTMRSHWKR